MGVNGSLCDFTPYAYSNPDGPECVAMFQIRARVVGDPTRTKHIWCRHGHNDWRLAEDGKPAAPLADRLLFRLPGLRKALRRQVPFVLWAEGEKDAEAGEHMVGEAGGGWYPDPFRPHMSYGPATSHPFGAGKATAEQAAHFRGYRGVVLLAVDDDDPGAACGLRRDRLLRAHGVRTRLVRAADGVGGGLGNGADLADHVNAGLSLSDLVPVSRAALESAAGRWASRQQQGWVYGVDTPPPLTAEERELVRQSPLLRNGWNGDPRIRA